MQTRPMKRKTFRGTSDPAVSQREFLNRRRSGEAAREGIVLLKNEGGCLPLREGQKIALYGRGARKTVKGGTGSGSVNERDIVTVYQGLKDAGLVITTDDWLDDYDARYETANLAWQAEIAEKSKRMWSFDAYCGTPFVAPDGDRVTGTDTDTAIVVISRIAGENADRRAVPGDYYFSRGEMALVGDVCSHYRDVILIINAGGQVDLTVMDRYDNIRALLILGMPGMAGGTALAEVLLGQVSPSGKLVDSWAYSYDDFPNAGSFSHRDGNTYMEYYREGIYVGYRYFDTFDVPVRYGFGSGISYTEFGLETQGVELEGSDVLARVRVTNTGNTYEGKEVVQVYATCPAGKLAKEYRRLVAFAKTGSLGPGQSETLELRFPVERLDSYDEELPGWVLEKGSYYLWVGNSLTASRLAAELRIPETLTVERTRNQCIRRAEMTELVPDTDRDLRKREALARMAGELGLPVLTLDAKAVPAREVVYRTNRELADPEAMAFVETLSRDQLLRLANGELRRDGTRRAIAGDPPTPGACGETSRAAEDRNLPSLLMSDGPAGLRLTQSYRIRDGKLSPTKSHPGYSEGKMVVVLDETPLAPGEEVRYQFCTAIPTGTQIAQSWNLELTRRLGELVATEMKEFGVTIWLAPGMNIHRNPLCGRNFEYFSEDPLLSGRMAAAMTQGVQATPGLMTMIKHFACNNQEDNRHFSNSIVSERTMREIYLKNFEIAVKEGEPWSVMSSYNMINGVHAANLFDLCTNILRNEWGFKGFVATDWRTTVHDGSCTASGCMRAGNDLNMPGFELDMRNLEKELLDGTLCLEDVRACVSRLVSVIWRSDQYEE